MAQITNKAAEALVSGYVQFSLDEGKFQEMNDPTRVAFLRVSSFPFCARQWYLRLPVASNISREVSVSDSWFLHVGTLFHDLSQKAMTHADHRVIHKVDAGNGIPLKSPQRSRLVANWVCNTCANVHVFQPHPASCDHCGSTKVMTHREHRVSYGGVVRGHMDGTVTLPPLDSPREPYSKKWIHIPLDFKTCSADKVKSGTGLPYSDNVSQLASYGAIKRKDGYNIPGTALVYVSRDNPHNRRTIYTPLDYKTQIEKIDGWVDLYKQANAARTIDLAMKLPPVVTTDFHKECTYCEFKTVCQSAEKGDLTLLRSQAERTVKFFARNPRITFPE